MNDLQKNALLKFMNLEEVGFDELRIILDLQLIETKTTDDPYEFWAEIAMKNIGGEFDKFYFKRGGRDTSTVCTIDGKPINYSLINEWCDENYETIEFVGGEGEGEYAHVVIRHLNSDRYLKIEGSYYSYDGFDWSDSSWEEVFPTEVTKIEYL